MFIIYLSVTVSNCDKEPPQSHHDKLAKQTEAFSTGHLKDVFGNNFQSVHVGIHHKEFSTGKVNKIYNVYLEWDIVTKIQDPSTAPDGNTLCTALIRLNITKLSVDNIPTIKATPFVDATAIFTQQVNS